MRRTFALTLFLSLILTTSALAQRELNSDRTTLFSGSGNCSLCHTSGNGANTTIAGEDVSPPSGWRSSMMASAARDPFWQAMVVAESMDHPELVEVIQDKCTNCHIPMGHEEAHAGGATSYSIAEGRTSAMYMEGVSCTLCHQVTPDNFGTAASFSGGYEIAQTRVTFGPYPNPLLQPMRNVSGFEPVYSPHMEQSELCATCHTLFTPYLDAQGQIAGEFPEQTPYLEWKEGFAAAEGRSCQSCHMPAREEAMRISTMPTTSPQRTPVFEHHFVGGNTFMLGLIRSNADALGATAENIHFDSTLARTRAQLTQRTVELEAGPATLKGDLLSFTVGVRNLTGHKFPTAFPSRRAWLHVTVRDAAQRTVFESGTWDDRGEITGLDDPFESHYQTITSADQVQIWESVMGDTEGMPTVQLLHGATYLKDNRIPPQGYSAAAMGNDTIGVVGTDGDAQFAVAEGFAFGGADEVDYHLTVDASWTPPFTVSVELCYQSIKPVFIDNLARHDAPELTLMRDAYAAAPSYVEIIARTEVESVVASSRPLPQAASLSLEAWPRPLSRASGMLHVAIERSGASGTGVLLVTNLLGQELRRQDLPAGPVRLQTRLDLTALRPGLYFLTAIIGDVRRTVSLNLLP